jgi:hypothetical protein
MSSLITRKRTKPNLRITLQEADRALKAWNASCGPNALAAALNLSLREVKKGVIDPFPGHMNPTQMAAALNYFGVKFAVEKNLHTQELRNGIGSSSGMARGSETLIGRLDTGTLIGSRAGMGGFLIPIR